MPRNLDQKFPTIADLEARAYQRIPHFASEFLRGGIGDETALDRNRQALNEILMKSVFLTETSDMPIDLGTTILGQKFDLPFGISPIGLTDLMWPGTMRYLAQAARDANIPIGLSNFATTSMVEFRQIAQSNGWFQMYAANDPEIRARQVEDVKAAGFDTLVLTIDVPGLTRRSREYRVGLSVPPELNFRTVQYIATKPHWAIRSALEGIPRFRNMEAYVPSDLGMTAAAHAMANLVVGRTGKDVVQEIRDLWPGKLLIKGVLSSEDTETAMRIGADGIWVSNHGGRQLDAAQSPVDLLPELRSLVGKNTPLLADSGVRNGLDIARMLSLGADFVFLGRAFIYSVCALGRAGPAHAIHILEQELHGTLTQLGVASVHDLRKAIVSQTND